ncbi:MAG TPA: hypothetical protein ENI06_05300, partial [Spirochaetales bacterium]|nr:hypothetical protein [Spirochaetales bacterium]
MKGLLGGKGANLAEMTNIGIPVPPGFTITTEVCDVYSKNNNKYPAPWAQEFLYWSSLPGWRLYRQA